MRTFATKEAALSFVMSDLTWGNAAGTCRDGDLAHRFAEAGMQSVEFGSITQDPRAGNSGDNFYYDEKTGNSVNSLGMPNRGMDAYLQELPAIRRKVNWCGALLWVSISAGDCYIPYEYEDMAAALDVNEAADVIEGNFSCPNMIVDGKSLPNVCYDLDAFKKGVWGLSCAARPRKTAVKIAPITEPAILSGLVGTCVEHEIDYLVVANTVGNCYLEKAPGTPAINMVRGGLAGSGVRPIIKGMLQMIKPKLSGTKTKLIAVGGVECGEDAYEYLCLGADGFQFNTVLTRHNYDPRIAQEIILGDESRNLRGLVDILFEQGLPDC